MLTMLREIWSFWAAVFERMDKVHMGLIAALTDRVVVLDHGRKLMEGTAVEAQSDPRVIEAYIGKEAADDAA